MRLIAIRGCALAILGGPIAIDNPPGGLRLRAIAIGCRLHTVGRRALAIGHGLITMRGSQSDLHLRAVGLRSQLGLRLEMIAI